jgi:hypothetical protein
MRFEARRAVSGGHCYPLEDIVDINGRVPAEAAFTATNQGRNVGVSTISAVDDHRFLVLERDGRGLDVENPALADPVINAVGTKRLYQIDLTQATDVSQRSLAGVSTLPMDVLPVEKRLLLDIQAALQGTDLSIPAKMEGVAIGPRLQDGQYSVVISTDNDFSTLEVEEPPGMFGFYDVYTDGTTGPLGGDAMGRSLLPLHLLALRVPSLIAPTGDFDQNGLLDVVDADRLSSEIAAGQHPSAFDLTTDQRVDAEDMRYFAKYLAKTWMGDADLNRQFDSADLVQVMQAGKYEQGILASWSQGDWLSDGRFNSADIVAAFQEGGYELGPRHALAAVPEPSSAILLILGLMLWRSRVE